MNGTSNALTALFKSGRECVYERGDIIIRAGDTPSGVYFIATGWVKIYTLCDDGESNIIMSLYPGDIFPLAWAITGIDQDVTFTALDKSRMLRIQREEFVSALQAQPTASQAALVVLSYYFLRLTSELENIHYRSARERVVFRLMVLATHFGSTDGAQTIINVRVPNEYIARSTNMTRETASREISRLVQKKLILHIDGHFVIPNLRALEKEAGTSLNVPARSSR